MMFNASSTPETDRITNLSGHQVIFWSLESVASGISLLAMVLLLAVHLKQGLLSRTPFVSFKVMLLGDCIFILNFYRFT